MGVGEINSLLLDPVRILSDVRCCVDHPGSFYGGAEIPRVLIVLVLLSWILPFSLLFQLRFQLRFRLNQNPGAHSSL